VDGTTVRDNPSSVVDGLHTRENPSSFVGERARETVRVRDR